MVDSSVFFVLEYLADVKAVIVSVSMDFLYRERRPPAVSFLKFRSVAQFPTGAAFLNGAVRLQVEDDASCTLRM